MAESRAGLIRDEADGVFGLPADPVHDAWLSESSHGDESETYPTDLTDTWQSASDFYEHVLQDHDPLWREQFARLAAASAIEAIPFTYRNPFLINAVKDGVAKALGLKPMDELKKEEGEA